LTGQIKDFIEFAKATPGYKFVLSVPEGTKFTKALDEAIQARNVTINWIQTAK
jgi:hypothetical protein